MGGGARWVLALATFTSVIGGCRAILGIEDPPPEGGDDASGTSGLASTGVGDVQGSTTSGAGTGGAPATSTGPGSGGTSSTNAVTTATSTGTGGGEPQPTHEVSLGTEGLRLAYDPYTGHVYALDIGGALHRFAVDLTAEEVCSGFVDGLGLGAPGALAASNERAAHANGSQVTFLQFPKGCSPEVMCTCNNSVQPIPAVGIAARDGFYYAADQVTGGFGPFGFALPTFEGVQPPPAGFTSPIGLTLGVSHAFVAGSGDSTAALAKFEVGGGSKPTLLRTEDQRRYLAVAASPDEANVFLWRQTSDELNDVIDLEGAVLTSPVYAGQPTLAADASHLFIPADTELQICGFDGTCVRARQDLGRIGDVLVVGGEPVGSLFVLQGTTLLRYDLDDF